jgi:serine/threonine protein phosphatase PrpC
MHDTAHIEVAAVSHTGRVRASNEDSITIAGWVSDVEMSAPRRSRHELIAPLLFAVADGMGGHAGGEVASRYAVKRLADQACEGAADIATLLAAINAELYQTMRAVPSLIGLGTTVAGLLLSAARALWFNVGDSRIYRERGGRLEMVEKAILADEQTLGGSRAFLPIAPHIGEHELVLPSRWLVCSDGLTDMLGDAEIERAMAASDEDALRAMFAAAMRAGGADNISIMLVRAAA